MTSYTEEAPDFGIFVDEWSVLDDNGGEDGFEQGDVVNYEILRRGI